MMAENKVTKKFTQRKILKDVTMKLFYDVKNYMDSDVEEERIKVTSLQEVLKKKLSMIKKLEDQIVELSEKDDEIELIIREGTEFEILAEEIMSSLKEFNEQHVRTKTELNSSQIRKDRDAVRLPKLEITKFSGNPILWQTFNDSYEAAINSSSSLSKVEKFNYLRSYLEGEALHTVSGLSLTNDNYEKALKLLKDRFGNPQLIISTHMNELLKLKKIHSDKDLSAIRRFYDDIEANVRSLQSLGIDSRNYGSLLSPLIMERLPHELKLIVSRNIKQDIWDLTKLLEIMNEEIRARENCSTPNSTLPEPQDKDGKNEFFDFSRDVPYSGSALYTSQSKPKVSCVFCRSPHWSDKCSVITDIEARKAFLRKGGRCFLCLKENHISRDCPKTKKCFYCKGLHNSAICNKRQKGENPNPISTNVHHAQGNVSVLLQTAEITLTDPGMKNEVKIKALFDSGSQRTYMSNRVRKILNLKTESTETMSINTFGNTTSKTSLVDQVKFLIKTKSHKSFCLQALSVPLICLPIKNQPVAFARENFEHLRGLDFQAGLQFDFFFSPGL